MGLPPFSEAEFWNAALWAPLGQELFTLLKTKAVGDRSVFARVTQSAVTKAGWAGVRIDRVELRRLLEQDRLLEALVIRDLAELTAALASLLVQTPSGWTDEQAGALVVAVLLLALEEELPADRRLDFAAYRLQIEKLHELETQLGRLEDQSRSETDLLRGLHSRVDRLPEEVGRHFRPVGYRDSYESVIKAFEEQHLPGLKDRETDLIDLARRIAGNAGYLAVEGPMYAGKSAVFTALRRRLADSGCEVAAFYIRRGSDDGAAEFLPKIITQLLEILERFDPRLASEGVATTLDARRTQLNYLWKHASTVSKQPVVLLIDALDEQQYDYQRRSGASPPISQLLPSDWGPQGRIVVSSRLNPDFSSAVPAEHPLADLSEAQRIHLSPSEHATAHREKVQRELDHHLASGNPTAEHVTGMYAISPAPLSDDELSDLLELTPGQVRQVREPVASSLIRFLDPDGTPRFAFGHELQREHVRIHLGARGLARLTEAVLAWARRYAESGWPNDTPPFLRDHLHTFVLNSTGRPDRAQHLLQLVTDERRQLFQRTLRYLDGFIATIDAAAEALMDRPVGPQRLGDQMWLLLHRIEATESAVAIPTGVLRILALTGHTNEVLGIASTLPDPAKRTHALVIAAVALAEAGELAEAREGAQLAWRLAAGLEDPRSQAEALAGAASALARAGELEQALQAAEQAQRVATDLDIRTLRAEALVRVAAAFAQAGQIGRAQQVASGISDPAWQVDAMVRVALVLVQGGHIAQARQIAREAGRLTARVSNLGRRAGALTSAANALAQTGRLAQARQLCGQAWQMAVRIDDPGWQAVTLVRVAVAYVQAGQVDRAWQVATSLSDPRRQATALARIGAVLAQAGQPEQALRAAEQAQQMAVQIADPRRQAEALAEVGVVLARAGQPEQALRAAEQARQVAVEVSDPRWRARALVRTANALGHTGDLGQASHAAEQARRAAIEIDDPPRRVAALASIARTFTQIGRHEQAQQTADQAWKIILDLSDRNEQAEACVRAAAAFASAGQLDYARRAAERVWQGAREIGDERLRGRELIRAATALARAGDVERAWQAIDQIDLARHRTEALIRVADALCQTGKLTEALQAAIGIPNTVRRAETLARVAIRFTDSGEHQQGQEVASQARQVANDLRDPGQRAHTLVQVAIALGYTGDFDSAWQVATEISDPGRRADVLVRVATGLAHAGEFAQARQAAEQAWEVANDVNDPRRRVECLIRIMVAYSLARDSVQSRHAAEQAWQITAELRDPGRQADMLVRVASGLAHAGDLNQARQAAVQAWQVAVEIRSRKQRSKALVQVAAALARAGQLDEARRAAAEITDPDRRARALSKVATAFVNVSEGTYTAAAVGVLQDALKIEDIYAQRELFLESFLTGLNLFPDELKRVVDRFIGST